MFLTQHDLGSNACPQVMVEPQMLVQNKEIEQHIKEKES